MGKLNLEIRTVDIKLLKPAAYNPRRDLKPGDAEYEKLAASIDRWDLQEPLVWNEDTGNLIGGHQRLKICKQRGDKEIQVVVVHLGLAQEKLLNIALNKISAGWDYEMLSEILRVYTPEELGITGFSADEITGLTGDAATAAADVMRQIGQTEPQPATAPESAGNSVYMPPETFEVYLSFPSRVSAESWLEQHGYEERFKPGIRALVIHDDEGGEAA